jgi:hypothetical protein
MRKFLLTSFTVAAMAIPAVAFAKPTQVPTTQTENGMQGPNRASKRINNGASNLGSGMVGGNEPGHVDSPGATKIDPESRGPINDVQPGRGTNDTPQSQNPKPVR